MQDSTLCNKERIIDGRRPAPPPRSTMVVSSLVKRLVIGGVGIGAAHSALNVASLANNTLTHRSTAESNALLAEQMAELRKSKQPLQAKLGEVVDQLWVEGYVDVLMFRSDVTFEDPMARCEGWSEVAQAFRTAKKLRGGTQLSPPMVAPGATDDDFIVHLHHQYNFGGQPVVRD